MSICEYCTDDDDMPYRCKYCEGTFCSKHRLPENHQCLGVTSTSADSRRFESAFSAAVEKPGTRGARYKPTQKHKTRRQEHEPTSSREFERSDSPQPRGQSGQRTEFGKLSGGDAGPDTNPDGTLAGDVPKLSVESDKLNSGFGSSILSALLRIPYSIFYTIRAALALLRHYAIPIIAFATVIGLVVFLIVIA
ncbi:AN1-type zinc finger domain-containing protein [Haladaptatus sp. GCM10025707]|uniref:AN1-type zinc finger protein n=1 Tax=unclassified Haladaptatus TaxID=2622732 RepID=UPI0023E766DA|nr:AN1-type zinc finger protein [Haladaptatus sp. QDMS2]